MGLLIIAVRSFFLPFFKDDRGSGPVFVVIVNKAGEKSDGVIKSVTDGNVGYAYFQSLTCFRAVLCIFYRLFVVAGV